MCCRRDILILLKLMVAAHFVDLAALLSQAQPPAFLEREIILHLQTHLPVGRAGVLVADVNGEDFNEAPRGPLPCPVNQRRQLRR